MCDTFEKSLPIGLVVNPLKRYDLRELLVCGFENGFNIGL